MTTETKTDKVDVTDPAAVQNARFEVQAEAAREAREGAKRGRKPNVMVEADEDDEDTTELDRLSVLIFRNEFTSVADDVFAHELPILKRLHGDDAVKVIAEDKVKVVGFDPNTEIERLQRKYNSKEGDPVGAIYRNDPRSLAKEAGVSYSAGEATKPASSTQSPAKKKVIGKKR